MTAGKQTAYYVFFAILENNYNCQSLKTTLILTDVVAMISNDPLQSRRDAS